MSASELRWSFAQKFYVDFNATASELASRLDALKDDHNVSPTTMQAISSDLSRLTKSLSDATGNLPSYDQRQCELQLKTLEKSIEGLRGASLNAPKFAFKRKVTKTKPPTEPASSELPFTKPYAVPLESARTLVEYTHRYLTIFDVRSPASSGEISISDLDNCIVNLLPGSDDNCAKIPAFHVQRVSRSVILLPQIAGSIILHDVSECVIVVGCHQFRMHNSTSVDVYLECGSDPIIEHCSSIRFAPYPNYLVQAVSLDDTKPFSVKDFSHILPTPSPNWSVLPEDKREKTMPVCALHDQALREEINRMLSVAQSLENGFR